MSLVSPLAAIRPARANDIEALAVLAAQTFPLACPPGSTDDDIAAFIDEVLSPERFAEYVADPQRDVLCAVTGGELAGYAMTVTGPIADPAINRLISVSPATELSKLYVGPGFHGRGVAPALMDGVAEIAARRGAHGVWLGVNQQNDRAQRFYAKCGFEQVGTKRFRVGAQLHHDYVMQRRF